MFYAVAYHFENPARSHGHICTSIEEVLRIAKPLARKGLDMLADIAWHTVFVDGRNQPADPYTLLESDDEDSVASVIEQISDAMQFQNIGYVEIHAREDLYELLDFIGADAWGSDTLKALIEIWQQSQHALIGLVNKEWQDDGTP